MRAAVPLARLRVSFLELSGIAMQWHALRSARKAHGIQKTLVLITLGWVASDRDTPGLAQRKNATRNPLVFYPDPRSACVRQRDPDHYPKGDTHQPPMAHALDILRAWIFCPFR